MDRRTLLQASAAALASTSLAPSAFAQATTPAPVMNKLKIDAYSRHLLWLKTPEDVADAVKEMAFDGLDITVRTNGGHVNPATVATDLPKFVGVIRSNDILVDMITTNIQDADSPYAESILDAASKLGIKNYWWGTFRYDLTKPIFPQLDALKPRVEKLAKLNEKYGMKALYHNYAGPGTVGDAIFDFLEVLKNFDPRDVGFHYDTGHASEAAGSGTWELGMRAAGPYIGGISFKDSYLQLNVVDNEGGPFTGTPEELNARGGGRGAPGGAPGAPGGAPGAPGGAPGAAGGRGGAAADAAPAAAAAGGGRRGAAGAAPAAGAAAAGGRGAGGGGRGGAAAGPATMPNNPRGGGGSANPWKLVQVPLGSGTVDLPKVATVMKDIGFQGPVEVQAEYSNGGAGNGQDKITLPRAMVLGAMKRDLLTLKAVLGPAGLI